MVRSAPRFAYAESPRTHLAHLLRDSIATGARACLWWRRRWQQQRTAVDFWHPINACMLLKILESDVAVRKRSG